VGGASTLGRYNISESNRLPKFGAVKNPFAPSATSEAKAVTSPEVKSEPAPTPKPECELVEQRVAELFRVTEEVCQPGGVPPSSPASEVSARKAGDDAGAPAHPFAKTQRIPQLADRGILGKVERVVGWLVRICAVVARLVAVAARKLWAFVRGIQWGSLLKSGRGFAVVAWTKTKRIATKLTGLIRKRDSKNVFPRLGKPAVQAELSLDSVRVVRNSLEDSDLEIVTAETTTSSQVAPTKPVAEPKRGPVPTALKKITGPLVSVKELAKALD
jgi:hypothetical protein